MRLSSLLFLGAAAIELSLWKKLWRNWVLCRRLEGIGGMSIGFDYST